MPISLRAPAFVLAAVLAACAGSAGVAPAPTGPPKAPPPPPPEAKDAVAALSEAGFDHPQGLDWPAARQEMPAAEAFKNVPVLGKVPAARLMLGMQSMQASLGVACDHCHARDFAADEKKPKQTARAMLRLALDVNNRFFGGRTYVTCYTCHRQDSPPDPFQATKPVPTWPLPALAAAEAEKPAREVYKNLKMLGDMPAGRLGEAMVAFSAALGVGCVHCHVRDRWAADDKEAKEAARAMMKMVGSIGATAFAGGKNPVRCGTCHRGDVHPARAAGPMVRVTAALAGGAAAPRAALVLGPAGFAPANRLELRDRMKGNEEKFLMVRVFQSTQAELGHLAPGSYSLCTATLPEDPNPSHDPKGGERPLSCAPLTVAPEPAEQAVTRELAPL